jgi:hypothetical protein
MITSSLQGEIDLALQTDTLSHPVRSVFVFVMLRKVKCEFLAFNGAGFSIGITIDE